MAAPGPEKRKSTRGRSKRPSHALIYEREINDMHNYVTDAPISTDAVMVIDEILRRAEAKCIEDADNIADPARNTLQTADLYASLRKAFILTDNQELVVSQVVAAVQATQQK